MSATLVPDPVDDATTVWPEGCELAEFGTLTIAGRVDGLAPDNRKVIFDPDPRVDEIASVAIR